MQKKTYENTVAMLQTGEDYKLETPIDVVHETTPLAENTAEIRGFDPKHDFNFLVVSQFGPRKNFTNTIRWFVEEFHDQEVGLIVKTCMKGSSRIDLDGTEGRFKDYFRAFPPIESVLCPCSMETCLKSK